MPSRVLAARRPAGTLRASAFRPLALLTVLAVVAFAACGGNVVVDSGSHGGSTSSSHTSATTNISSTANVTPGDVTSGVTINSSVGPGPAMQSVVASTVASTAVVSSAVVSSAVVSSAVVSVVSSSAQTGPCSTSCATILFQGGPPPCGGLAASAYDNLISCACTPTGCITECGANFCAHMAATGSCLGCLMGSCPMSLQFCMQN